MSLIFLSLPFGHYKSEAFAQGQALPLGKALLTAKALVQGFLLEITKAAGGKKPQQEQQLGSVLVNSLLALLHTVQQPSLFPSSANAADRALPLCKAFAVLPLLKACLPCPLLHLLAGLVLGFLHSHSSIKQLVFCYFQGDFLSQLSNPFQVIQ